MVETTKCPGLEVEAEEQRDPEHTEYERRHCDGCGRATLTEKERTLVQLAQAEDRRVRSMKRTLPHWLDRNIRTFAVDDRSRLLAIIDRLTGKGEPRG